MKSFEETLSMARRIALLVNEQGGEAYFVGGYVRDKIRGEENKDIDIEIHGIAPNTLEEVLSHFGTPMEIGKSFGVYKLRGYSLDIALPRKEKQTGKGHRDFKIDVDPFIGTRKAAMRRDFTVNSIMENVLTGEIVDHFGGVDDLVKGVLRHIDDDAFGEDVLRVLRGAQFAARFGYKIASKTKDLCRKFDLRELSRERVFEEMRKALIKAPKPSLFFECLRELNQLDVWFAELQSLIGVNQDEKYHKEGDVWNHTMLVLDEAAKYRHKTENPMGFMLSALTHDFGKTVTTTKTDGKIHSYRHETEGLPIIREFLHRITNENALISYVLNMAKLHMKPPICFRDKSSIKATNKLFDESVSPQDLIYLSLSDGLGQRPGKPTEEIEEFLMERLTIFNEYMAREYVGGKDLIENGIPQGQGFSDILAYAHKLRLAGVEKEEALRQVLSYAKKM